MTPLVAVRDLTFAYRRTAPPVIAGLTSEFPAGSFTAVIGNSGTGKSTLLYILALMLRAVKGEVLWYGRSVSKLADGHGARIRAARAGFVFQDALLDPARTVLDNVCEPAIFAGIPIRKTRLRARDLLEQFEVGHRADHRPGEISGGQAQRVALCRALITDPDVIFGDEPTGNLDDQTAAIVWNALQSRARAGAAVIVATHNLSLAQRADSILDLNP